MLSSLFSPKNVAVIGASSRELHIGNRIIKNLLHFGYKGNIFPINPNADNVCGLKVYKSILDVYEDVDVVHIVIPAKFVPVAVEECGIKGVKNVIINSGGFSEVGLEGEKIQKTFIDIAKKYNVRILGPNCQGIINSDNNIRAYCNFTFTFPEAGNISIVSLSGGVGELIHQNIVSRGVGTRIYVSSGNSCDISVLELIKYLGNDSSTKVIILYVEGLREQSLFIEEVKKISLKKPILAMRAGKTKEGAKAAASHTGTMVGNGDSLDLVFKKSGILGFKTEKDLIDSAIVLGTQPFPSGNKVGIITNTGGPAVIASDALVKYGFKIKDLHVESVNILKKKLHKGSSVGNPVDVLATGTSDHYRLCLDVMIGDQNVDIIFVIFVTPFFVDAESIAKEIAKVSSKKIKPIVCNFITDDKIWEKSDKILKKNNVPCFALPSDAAKSLLSFNEYGKIRRAPLEEPKVYNDIKSDSVFRIINLNKLNKIRFLSAFDVYTMLQDYGICVPLWDVADNFDEAIDAVERIGYPVVIKVDSEMLVHKSDFGGVFLNLSEKFEVEKVLNDILFKFRDKYHNFKFFIQKYLPGVPEFVLGAKFVNGVGHSLMFGLGGVLVEVLKDVTFELAPITEFEANNMVHSIKNREILSGFRGGEMVNVDLLVDLIQRLSKLVSDFPDIYELDFNPVVSFEDKVVVLDARIILGT